MTEQEKKLFRREFPEIGDGHWILTRNYTLFEAIRLANLRRVAFPATVPEKKVDCGP